MRSAGLLAGCLAGIFCSAGSVLAARSEEESNAVESTVTWTVDHCVPVGDPVAPGERRAVWFEVPRALPGRPSRGEIHLELSAAGGSLPAPRGVDFLIEGMGWRSFSDRTSPACPRGETCSPIQRVRATVAVPGGFPEIVELRSRLDEPLDIARVCLSLVGSRPADPEDLPETVAGGAPACNATGARSAPFGAAFMVMLAIGWLSTAGRRQERKTG